jgi:hypothetical protein
MSRTNFSAWAQRRIANIVSNTNLDKTTKEDIRDLIIHEHEFALHQFDKLDKTKVLTEIYQIFENAKSAYLSTKRVDSQHLFKEMTVEIPIIIDMKYSREVKAAVNHKLDSFLLKYDPHFGGMVLLYKNVKILSKTGNLSYNPSEPGISLKIQVTLILFCPRPKIKLIGVVSHIEKDFISLTVHGVINAKIAKRNIQNKVVENDVLEFEVLRCDHTYDNFITIEGVISK